MCAWLATWSTLYCSALHCTCVSLFFFINFVAQRHLENELHVLVIFDPFGTHEHGQWYSSDCSTNFVIYWRAYASVRQHSANACIFLQRHILHLVKNEPEKKMYTIDDYDWRFPSKEVHYSLMAYIHTPNELWEQNLSQTYDISGVFFTISYGAAENNTALVLETHFTVAKTFFCHSSTIHMCNLHVSRIQSMQLVHVKCTETLQFKIHSEKRKKNSERTISLCNRK